MANRHDKNLPELELHEHQAKEALQVILHTIVFLRAPKKLSIGTDVIDCHTSSFPLPYAKLRFPEVTSMIDDSLQTFFQTGLSPIGPELSKGVVALDFYVNKVRGGNGGGGGRGG
jgi:autophagy-related protein 101